MPVDSALLNFSLPFHTEVIQLLFDDAFARSLVIEFTLDILGLWFGILRSSERHSANMPCAHPTMSAVDGLS